MKDLQDYADMCRLSDAGLTWVPGVCCGGVLVAGLGGDLGGWVCGLHNLARCASVWSSLALQAADGWKVFLESRARCCGRDSQAVKSTLVFPYSIGLRGLIIPAKCYIITVPSRHPLDQH